MVPSDPSDRLFFVGQQPVRLRTAPYLTENLANRLTIRLENRLARNLNILLPLTCYFHNGDRICADPVGSVCSSGKVIMLKNAVCAILAFICLVPASAEPFRIQDVTSELERFGARSLSRAILYGQPTITGQIQRFGFQVGLRNCTRTNVDEDLYCHEVAFKSCVQILPVYTREQVLEFANTYNKSRRVGQAYIDSDPFLGPIMCVKVRTDYEYDDTTFSINDVHTWEQAIGDFRSFLIGESIDLVDPGIL